MIMEKKRKKKETSVAENNSDVIEIIERVLHQNNKIIEMNYMIIKHFSNPISIMSKFNDKKFMEEL